MFVRSEAAFRQRFPEFKLESLLGTSIDVFHKRPEHQRKLLRDISHKVSATIDVGVGQFDLEATPMRDQDGHYQGAFVLWEDITEFYQMARSLGRGEFSQRIDQQGLDGSMATLAGLLNEAAVGMESPMQAIADYLQPFSRGDLSQKLEGDFQGAFGAMQESINHSLEAFSRVVGGIRESSDSVNSAAREIASGNDDLSRRMEQQAATLEQTSSAMEGLKGKVEENADAARRSDHNVRSTADLAEKGAAVVARVVEKMQQIEVSSSQIADFTGVIDSIAFQTNLLALNAAVEAARAGDQGRGFAVVAQEVRALAQRASDSAKEIKSVLEASSARVAEGAQEVAEAGAVIERINAAVAEVRDMIAGIAGASAEQAESIAQLGQAVADIDNVTQENAAMVEQVSAASMALEEQASALQEAVAVFRLQSGAA